MEGNTGSGKKPNFLKKKEGETNFVTTEYKKFQNKNTQNSYHAPSRSPIFEYHVAEGFITPILGRVPESPGPWFNLNATCTYHSGVIGHSIKQCRSLKYNVQHLVDTKQLTFEDAPLDVHRNPLPNHGNQGINVAERAQGGSYIWEVPEIKTPMKVIFQEMLEEPPKVTNVAGVSRITMSERVYGPLDVEKVPTNTGKGKAKVKIPTDEEVEAGLGEPIIPEDKGGVSNEEACEFLKFIRQNEYKVADQLSRTPARISILALVMSFEAHRNVLLKVLNQAHVSNDITTDKLSGIVNNIVADNYISFSDQEIPAEGTGHTSMLHISVMYQDCLVASKVYKPTRKDWEKTAEEKRKGRMARLGQFEYKAGGILIPHIGQSFISASFASGTMAVVGDFGPENQTNNVIQCPPGNVLNNWTEEDMSPRVFYENM
ncbi:hypothetical protein Lal_00018654 [Lupinus albus]|nr:hypothetical protein Lal_00018654 [Lupinus albus]